eukprot:TRINITY_DN12953_c0_g1_i1.p1 TRINITY_DN12953_c0_g1~~TRINITY_DN12953_c0_g1_i1.p1  ORF type:complete len:514 (+),score=141.26 TRINITY_DN12953_c0_g1_i1:75-1616(+)
MPQANSRKTSRRREADSDPDENPPIIGAAAPKRSAAGSGSGAPPSASAGGEWWRSPLDVSQFETQLRRFPEWFSGDSLGALAGVPSWLLMLVTVAVGAAGGLWLVRRRRRRHPSVRWGLTPGQLQQVGDAAAMLAPAVDAALREKGAKPLGQRRLQTALGFLAGEQVQLAAAADVCRDMVLQDGATVPPRRLVQELEFYSEFADAAGTDTAKVRRRLLTREFTLLAQSAASPDGTPPYYLAFSARKRVAVLAIRDESSSESWARTLTDGLINPVPYGLDDCSTTMRQAVARGALQLVTELRAVCTDLFVAQGYSVLVVGHSLAGACAAIVAMLLRQEGQLQSVRALCYGPPPALDRASALACKGYVTSVVLQADCIPRGSAAAIRVSAAALSGVSKMLSSSGEGRTKSKIVDIFREAARGVAADKELHVAGTVVYVYSGTMGVSAAQLDGTLPCLQQLELSPPMFADHTRSRYHSALQQLLARLPPDDPSWHLCGTDPPSRGVSRSPRNSAGQ